MGVAVVVVPGFFVFVASMLRGDLFKCGVDVVIDKTRFIFDRCDPGGGADIEDRDRSVR
jgi:hypothetical protein